MFQFVKYMLRYLPTRTETVGSIIDCEFQDLDAKEEFAITGGGTQISLAASATIKEEELIDEFLRLREISAEQGGQLREQFA